MFGSNCPKKLSNTYYLKKKIEQNNLGDVI